MAAAVLVDVARTVLAVSGVTAAVVGPESAASLTVSLVHASPKAAIRATSVFSEVFLCWLANWTNVIRPSRILAVWIFKTAHGRPD